MSLKTQTAKQTGHSEDVILLESSLTTLGHGKMGSDVSLAGRDGDFCRKEVSAYIGRNTLRQSLAQCVNATACAGSAQTKTTRFMRLTFEQHFNCLAMSCSFVVKIRKEIVNKRAVLKR